MAINGSLRLRPRSHLAILAMCYSLRKSIALARDITSQPLDCTVEKIHESLMRMDDDYLRSALDYLVLQSDLTALILGPHTFPIPNLNVTSWLSLPTYDADFGYIWAQPLSFMKELDTYYQAQPEMGIFR